jgi:hypothetical protein
VGPGGIEVRSSSFAEKSEVIRNLTHLLPSSLRVNLLRDAQFLFGLAAGKNCALRRTAWHELQSQSADCLELVLSGSLGQSIRPFKPVWSFDSHLPILASVRSGDGHAPLSWFVTQGVLYTRNNFPAQLRIPEILQLDRYSHRTAILIENLLSLSLQIGQGDAGWGGQAGLRTAYPEFQLISREERRMRCQRRSPCTSCPYKGNLTRATTSPGK